MTFKWLWTWHDCRGQTWVFHQLPIDWDFQPLECKENGPRKRKNQLLCRGKKCLVDVRGQWSQWADLSETVELKWRLLTTLLRKQAFHQFVSCTLLFCEKSYVFFTIHWSTFFIHFVVLARLLWVSRTLKWMRKQHILQQVAGLSFCMWKCLGMLVHHGPHKKPLLGVLLLFWGGAEGGGGGSLMNRDWRCW